MLKKDHLPLTDQKFDENHDLDMKEKENKETNTGAISTIDLLKPTTLVALSTGSVEYMSGIQ